MLKLNEIFYKSLSSINLDVPADYGHFRTNLMVKFKPIVWLTVS